MSFQIRALEMPPLGLLSGTNPGGGRGGGRGRGRGTGGPGSGFVIYQDPLDPIRLLNRLMAFIRGWLTRIRTNAILGWNY